jgi:phage/plasmid-like protein (TIGR03299 family)
MAHQLEQIAYVGTTPWHNLGNALPAKQPLDVWARQAGMDWTIQETPVRFLTEQAGALGSIQSFDAQKVLYRSDTKAPLSVVSQRYQVVQPRDVLEFYRDLTDISGYELETAGVLKAGKKFWALARTGKSCNLKGNDTVNSYLLLATSCDGRAAGSGATVFRNMSSCRSSTNWPSPANRPPTSPSCWAARNCRSTVSTGTKP